MTDHRGSCCRFVSPPRVRCMAVPRSVAWDCHTPGFGSGYHLVNTSINTSINTSTNTSINTSINQSTHPSVYLYIHPPAHPVLRYGTVTRQASDLVTTWSTHPSTSQHIHQSIYTFIHPHTPFCGMGLSHVRLRIWLPPDQHINQSVNTSINQ